MLSHAGVLSGGLHQKTAMVAGFAGMRFHVALRVPSLRSDSAVLRHQGSPPGPAPAGRGTVMWELGQP